VTGELFAALIDKEPMLIGGFGINAVFFNVERDQPDGCGLQLNLPEAIAFA
jgi:hypothetical protein